MKITKQQLRKIIREELFKESGFGTAASGTTGATEDTLKKGDTVLWRKSNTAPAMETKIVGIEIYGERDRRTGRTTTTRVSEVPWSTVKADRVLLTLDNGEWAYGWQVGHGVIITQKRWQT